MAENQSAVRCMLLPLNSLNLIVPNSSVAEIIGYSTPRQLADCSDWFSGVVLWRGVYIPVIAVEQMCRLGAPQAGPRARIAIIYNPERDDELPYVGIQMQDIPRAYLADQNTIGSANDDNTSGYLLCRVDDDEQVRAVPDLDKIIADLKLEFSQQRIEELSR